MLAACHKGTPAIERAITDDFTQRGGRVQALACNATHCAVFVDDQLVEVKLSREVDGGLVWQSDAFLVKQAMLKDVIGDAARSVGERGAVICAGNAWLVPGQQYACAVGKGKAFVSVASSGQLRVDLALTPHEAAAREAKEDRSRLRMLSRSLDREPGAAAVDSDAEGLPGETTCPPAVIP